MDPLAGRPRAAVEPVELVDAVAADLQAVVDAHRGDRAPCRPRRRGRGASRPSRRRRGRRARSRPSASRSCRRCSPSCSRAAARAPRRRCEAAELEERFRLTPQELKESLDLLNLVNFGGGCYAVYCSTENGTIVVDKELYGDAFRRPARLSPLEAKALLRALDVVAPLVAAEADTSLATVREKVEAAFGALRRSPTRRCRRRPAPRSTPSRS